MKFRIQGANKANGDDVDITLQAIDSKAAELVANQRGIMISSITAMPEVVNLDPIEMDEELDAPPPAVATATAVLAAPPATATSNNPQVVEVSAHAPPAPHGAPTPHDSMHGEAHGDPDHPTTHMEYKLMQNQALYLLEKSVNKMILAGWEPQGGLTIAIANNAPNYFQALIRRPKAEAHQDTPHPPT